MDKQQNPHDGHRERLRNKVQRYGLNSLAEHEVLEYLLTYAIPRRNTNDLAHLLLDKFANIENVLNASVSELKLIDGIGENAALFISSLGQLYTILKTNTSGSVTLKTTRECVTYFRSRYQVNEKECMYMMCFNAMGRLIKTEVFDGNCATIGINKQEFIAALGNKDIISCVIVHTHPNGEARPSSEDIEATKNLMAICMLVGVQMYDHIIFNEKEYYSFGSNHILDKIIEELSPSYPKHSRLTTLSNYHYSYD